MGYDERQPLSARASIKLHLRGSRPGAAGGALLIIFGTLLFLDNLGLLPVSVFDAFWPILFLGAGLYGLGVYGFCRNASPAIRIFSGFAIFAGMLLVLDDFHLIHVTMATLLPLAMIALGTVMVVHRLQWSGLTNRFAILSNMSARSVGNRLDELAVFSQVRRRIETQSFEGGDLFSVFGGIELDLRWAGIATPGRIAALEANAIFGAIELRIPETWRISMQGNAVFGAYEDKTIPPRPEPGIDPPTLVIRGASAFGAVTIRN